MNHTTLQKYLGITLIFACTLLLLPFAINKISTPPKAYAASPIQHVFIILMENHDWSQVKGSSSPYITNTLLKMGGHAEQYYNPPGLHPSAPNYVWLEAGAAVGGAGDCKPTDSGCSSSANHLSKLLDAAGISWKEYAEDATGTNCILDFSKVDVNHVGFSYFTDVTNNNPNSANCIAHERPYTELASALANNTVPRYTFITPNLNDDMHNGTIPQGDAWLAREVPKIVNSQAYKNNGVLFITWDEGEGNDGPIGMIVLSPLAKKNYTNTIHYDHSSMLKTLEEIFGVSPMLGGAAKATDLSDFFTTSLTSGGPTNKPLPTPTNVSPTFNCLGSCPTTPSPTSKLTGNPTIPPVTTVPSVAPCSNGVQTASVHTFKVRKRMNGQIGNLFLLLVRFLLLLLQQLLGGGITVPPTPTPVPSAAPSSAPGVSPSIGPSNPCPSPTSASVSPGTSSNTLGPKTSLHYTANGNFSGNTYTPRADGFNVADVGSVSQINNLPAGVKALVDLNSCVGATSSFTSAVQPYIGNSKVFGFFLIDEPDPTGKYKTLCPASHLKAESDWIHQHDAGSKTFIVVMNMASSKTPTYINTYNPSNSDIDLYGIDAYPCRTDYNGCDYSIVNRNITAATAAGIPLAAIVPVYQAFGGGAWKTDGGGSYIMPSAGQETQLLKTWASVVPSPVMDYAYSWGVQNGDQALSGDTSLKQIFITHNK